MHTPHPSAHACTTPAKGTNPYQRPYKPRNYGHVVAGNGQDRLTGAMPAPVTAIVNFSAFEDTLPPDPPHAAANAAYYHARALQYIAMLRAAYALNSQIWAVLGVPKALGAALSASECLIEQEVKDHISKHAAAGGQDAAALQAALERVKKEGGAT